MKDTIVSRWFGETNFEGLVSNLDFCLLAVCYHYVVRHTGLDNAQSRRIGGIMKEDVMLKTGGGVVVGIAIYCQV